MQQTATHTTPERSDALTRRKNPLIPSMVPIGHRIREARDRRGLTQISLARKLGTSAQDVGQIENGWRAASVPRLHGIADVLGVDPDWLLTGIDPALARVVRRLLADQAKEREAAVAKAGSGVVTRRRKPKAG